MRRALLLEAPAGGGRPAQAHELALGDVVVTIRARAYDPVLDEGERVRVRQASLAAETAEDLLALLDPGTADRLRGMAGETLQAAGTVWLAALIGAEAVEAWEGVADGDGRPLEWTPERWQLACFTVPGFARAFLGAWLLPRTVEIAAGNA